MTEDRRLQSACACHAKHQWKKKEKRVIVDRYGTGGEERQQGGDAITKRVWIGLANRNTDPPMQLCRQDVADDPIPNLNKVLRTI